MCAVCVSDNSRVILFLLPAFAEHVLNDRLQMRAYGATKQMSLCQCERVRVN